jgi:hypothetical protein
VLFRSGAIGTAGNVLLRAARRRLLPWEGAGRRGSGEGSGHG